MKDILQLIDIFPHKINLNYKRKPHFYTIFGIIQSFLICFVLGFCFYKFSEDMIYRQNPKIGYEESLLNKSISEKFDLSNIIGSINYTFTVQINTNNRIENMKQLLESYFTINLNFLTYENYKINRYSTKNITSIKIKNFTIFNKTQEINNEGNDYDDNDDNDNNQFISSPNLTYSYRVKFYFVIGNQTKFFLKCHYNSYENCDRLNSSQDGFSVNLLQSYNNSLNLSAIETQVTFSHAKLNQDVMYEIYSQFNNKNLSNKDFDIILEKKRGKINLIDSLIDSKKEDFSNIGKNQFEFENEGWSYIYKIVELIDDKDWVFTNNVEDYVLQEDWYFQIPIKEGGYENYLDVFCFTVSKIMKSHTRIYKKVQNVLSEINGILNVLIFMGNLVIGKFNKLNFQMEVVNNLYRLEEEQIKLIVNNHIKEIFPNENNNNANNNFNQKYRQKIVPDASLIKDDNNSKNLSDIKFKKLNDVKTEISNNLKKKKFLLTSLEFKRNTFANETSANNPSRYEDHKDDNNKITSPSKITNLFVKNTPVIENIKNIENNDQSIVCLNSKNVPVSPLNQNDHQDSDFYLRQKVKDFLHNKQANKGKNKLIKFNYSDILKSVLCLKKYKDENMIKQEEIISYTEKKIYGYLDVIRLMKLFEKFEKLKRIVLNQNQTGGFDYFKSRGFEEIYKNKEKDLFEFCKYYKEKDICNKKYDAVADQVILSSLKDDLKILLE